MKFGVSLSAIAQQPAGADMQQAFADICAYVGAARDLGFDMVYQGQHYLTNPYQQLQTMPLLARISAEARGMGLVATMLIPLHHPVDLAERVATMDVITGGNFTLSAALGYRDEEYDNFGVPRRTRVSRYLECLEAMRLLWSGEKVNYEGQYFRLQDAQLMLRPVQQPHPPVWVAANSDAAITRAARMGYIWYVNPHAKFDTISQQVEMYHEAAGAANSGAPDRLPLGREVFVGRTHEEAFANAAPYLGGKYEAYAQWGQDKALPGDENFREPFEDLARDRFVIGSPDEVVEELSRYRALGMSHGCFRMMWPGMPLDDGIANLELFADRVAPQLREG